MGAPPLLEFEIARRFGIDLGIKIVGLSPIGVGGVEIFEVANQPCAVEFTISKITHHSGQPAAAEQPRCSAWGSLHAPQPSRIEASLQPQLDQTARAFWLPP